MNRPPDHADADQPHPVSPAFRGPTVADRLAHLRALVDAFVACGQDLRTLHQQCMALLQDADVSSEQRRTQLQQILRTEQDLLAESLGMHHQLVHFLRVEHMQPQACTQEGAGGRQTAPPGPEPRAEAR